MTKSEKRKHPRIKIYYPISYVYTDKKGSTLKQSMGVALNISQSGILIETADSVFHKYISLRSVDLSGKFIEIKGKVAYCKKNESTKYRVGISFEGTNAQNIRFVKGLIRSYYYNKDEYRNSPAPQPKTAAML
jgi:hypothetical protein